MRAFCQIEFIPASTFYATLLNPISMSIHTYIYVIVSLLLAHLAALRHLIVRPRNFNCPWCVVRLRWDTSVTNSSSPRPSPAVTSAQGLRSVCYKDGTCQRMVVAASSVLVGWNADSDSSAVRVHRVIMLRDSHMYLWFGGKSTQTRVER